MFEPGILWAFFASALFLGLVPGPDNLFVLSQASQKGRYAGLAVTMGLCTGLIGHTLAVAFGLSLIFQNSEFAFNALKIVGATYLVYLAYQSFKAGASNQLPESDNKQQWLKLYGRGIIMNISNPKVALFFLAFLPQFTNPEAGNLVLQFIILGLVFILATIIVFGSISLLSGSLGEKFRESQQAQGILNKLAGVLFAGLALKLILAER